MSFTVTGLDGQRVCLIFVCQSCKSKVSTTLSRKAAYDYMFPAGLCERVICAWCEATMKKAIGPGAERPDDALEEANEIGARMLKQERERGVRLR